MAKKEVQTDLWVNDLLKDADIKADPQWSSIIEVDEALKTASKSGSWKVWFPEYIAVVKDFLIVIEDKAKLEYHVKYDDKNLIDQDVKSIKEYAINGVLHYGNHLMANTSYKKIIAIAVSGNEKKHKITPLFIDERGFYPKVLSDVETFISFNANNIDEWYTKEILKEETNQEKTTEELVKDAKELHEDFWKYWAIKNEDKPLIVSGILLALEEIGHKNFSIDALNGDTVNTDGQKIFDAIADNLKRANVSPDVKKDKLLSQFSVIKDTKKINDINDTLGKTPLKHYTEFLYNNIHKSITKSGEDYLWRFYSEFMSYSGGWDGQTLWIVLTPKHITELFCDLADLKPTDKVLDPCCGTGGFLISAMHTMLQKSTDQNQRNKIRKDQLYGIELQSYMFTIATTNMILRGDGKSNLENDDFLKTDASSLQLKGCTVWMMNPPYSQWSKKDPNLYEIAFTEHLLNSLTKGGIGIVIVPQSAFTGKTKEEQSIKENILKHHTLEWVITLNKNTFYGVGTNPCIAIFTTWEPHPSDKECKFINFENDGYEVQKQKWLVKTSSAKDKKQHLLDVWFDRIEAETKFCVYTTIEASDERLHSFYYFNDEIPIEADFEKTMADYLTFEFDMITHGRWYLFDNHNEYDK